MRPGTARLASVILLSTLTLGGCSWFNDVGEHFPVIGQRCEYWQCFTEYGQQQSDAIRQAKENAEQQQASGVPSNAKPVNAPGDYNTPADSASANQAPPHSHVEFIDPDKLGPVDLSQPPPSP